eukprot:3714714-Prymnesium_polylepis.1
MEEASSAGHVLLLHYNWKYIFIRPTAEEVCARYLAKHGQFVNHTPHPTRNGEKARVAPRPKLVPSCSPSTADPALLSG